MFDVETLPQYTHLYSVSDLHLWGYSGDHNGYPRDFRIFDGKHAGALAWLIDAVSRTADACPETALVLNGDVVDFLACRYAKGFDAPNALRHLKGIVEDPVFQPIWEALRRFVKRKKGDLVIVLGNHDVELALPDVQRYLIHYLTSGDRSARAHVLFSLDGSGFRCRVGDAQVLLIHGNEVDAFNAVDYGSLHLTARAVNFEDQAPDFTVNAGSTLVTAAMNDIKRRFQWIDLLKPETEAAVRIISAMPRELFDEVSLRQALDTVYRVGKIALRDRRRIEHGLLGGDDEEAGAGMFDARIAAKLDALLGQPRQTGLSDVDALVKKAEYQLAMGVRPEDLLGRDGNGQRISAEEMLTVRGGILRDLRTAFTKDTEAKKRRLRETIAEVLACDTSFDPTGPDMALPKLDKRVGIAIDFLITGHTHFERSLERPFAGTYYFNSGTWIRLIDLRDKLDKGTFDKVWNILMDGSMACLDGDLGAPMLETAVYDNDDPNRLERQAPMRLTQVIRSVVHLETLTEERAKSEGLSEGTVIGSLKHVETVPGVSTGGTHEMVENRRTRRTWNSRGAF